MATKTETTNMKTFRIAKVEEIKQANGNTFTAFKVRAKGNRLMDCRFVRTCKNVPTEVCDIVVKEENANVDNSRMYPILWIKEVEEIRPVVKTSNLDNYFDAE